MKHFIYKTINLINGKYYIGAHSTCKENDNYLGSGKRLKRAIKKYGKQNFKREIVEYCDNIEELYLLEQNIIDKHINDKNCYNMNKGGKGGWFAVNSSGIHLGKNNVMNRCPEIKQKVIDKMIQTKLSNKEYYGNISRENGKKAKEKCAGVKRPQISEKSRENSKKMWSENYERLRDCLSSHFEVVSPIGEKFITNRLQDFCIQKNLTYTSLWKTSTNNKLVKKGRSKGWTCKKISHN